MKFKTNNIIELLNIIGYLIILLINFIGVVAWLILLIFHDFIHWWAFVIIIVGSYNIVRLYPKLHEKIIDFIKYKLKYYGE